MKERPLRFDGAISRVAPPVQRAVTAYCALKQPDCDRRRRASITPLIREFWAAKAQPETTQFVNLGNWSRRDTDFAWRFVQKVALLKGGPPDVNGDGSQELFTLLQKLRLQSDYRLERSLSEQKEPPRPPAFTWNSSRSDAFARKNALHPNKGEEGRYHERQTTLRPGETRFVVERALTCLETPSRSPFMALAIRYFHAGTKEQQLEIEQQIPCLFVDQLTQYRADFGPLPNWRYVVECLRETMVLVPSQQWSEAVVSGWVPGMLASLNPADLPGSRKELIEFFDFVEDECGTDYSGMRWYMLAAL